MPIEIFWFNNQRNKCEDIGRSVLSLKKTLEKKKGLKCYMCKKRFEKIYSLNLEHKIPVEIGGRIFCLTNLDFICKKCHKEKTLIDKRIIKFMKDSGIFIGKISNCFYPLEKIRKKYLELFEINKECAQKQNIWMNGFNGKDYIQKEDKSNREILE